MSEIRLSAVNTEKEFSTVDIICKPLVTEVTHRLLRIVFGFWSKLDTKFTN